MYINVCFSFLNSGIPEGWIHTRTRTTTSKNGRLERQQ